MRFMRGFSLAAVCALVLGGCIKMKQSTVVMPDGSGKMDIRVGFNAKAIDEAMSSMGGGMGGAMKDPTSIDMEDLDKDMNGFVAFTRPVQEESPDGWKYVTFTGYFEDINKVELLDDGEGGEGKQKQVSFSFKKGEDGGYTLEVKSAFSGFSELGQLDQMGGGGDMGDVPPEMKQMMESMKKMVEAMFEGFEFSESFTMPGPVTKAEGLTSHEGRLATFAVTRKDLAKPADAAKLGEAKTFLIQSGASAVSEADLAAFREEMKNAKAEWEKMKAEAKAKAKPSEGEEEPSEPGEDEGGGDEGGGDSD